MSALACSGGCGLLLPSEALDRCLTESKRNDPGAFSPTRVTLHVYRVPTAAAVDKEGKNCGEVGKVGAFHGALEVHGREWSFGHSEKGSGVFCSSPKESEARMYLHSLPMGKTFLSKARVLATIGKLAKQWQGKDYDLRHCNCCHFANAFLAELGLGPLPRQFLSLAGAGASMSDRPLFAKAVTLAVAQAAAAHAVSNIAATARPLWRNADEMSDAEIIVPPSLSLGTTLCKASSWSCRRPSSCPRYQRCN
eukprot:TRINITY_DN46004_c0_g1_i1.p1 TRINITY_DN46004_c0_g1~~TRINITY_DN46004_c0_g1_i1.p1  ORF type:complete len:268 (+),score=37.27 TRINITY_DN46004_c0_g1_i1:53-805(+)